MKSKHSKQLNRAFALSCLHDDDDNDKLTWQRVMGAIQGTAEPLHFPMSYPAIDLDPATKKMFINGCLILGGAIIVGSALSGAIRR